MKRAFLLVLILTVFGVNGCVYTHVTMPLTTELNKTELGHKQGQSSMYSLLWLFAWGDSGAATAARQAGITIMTHMDREFESVLFGIYTKTSTVVYGD